MTVDFMNNTKETIISIFPSQCVIPIQPPRVHNREHLSKIRSLYNEKQFIRSAGNVNSGASL